MNARLSFDAELESLSASLIRMGALATDAIDDQHLRETVSDIIKNVKA